MPGGGSAGTATRLARDVAVIVDGNGRWARRRGLPVAEGHRAGARAVTLRALDAAELGVEQLVVYAFSTENWSRGREEVGALLGTLDEELSARAADVAARGIRIRFVGRRAGLPGALLERMDWAESLTAEGRAMTLYVALNYGGRAEIVDAARAFAGETEDDFRACLYAPDMRDPEILIRTGGERRLSNCLLWQAAYAELVFVDALWPDFSRPMLERALSPAAGAPPRTPSGPR